MATLIYVDESGDLGWSFESLYGRGGSSRYLTIAAMILPEMLDHLPERKVRHLYRQGNWDSLGLASQTVDFFASVVLAFSMSQVAIK